MLKKTRSKYLRNFVFGIEDSLVSTIGLISGVAVTGMAKHVIILTGFVLIFVEAFSMSVGVILSENSEAEYSKHEDVSISDTFGSATIMFLSYFVAGLLVITPYMLFEINQAFVFSIAVSLVLLFLLGIFSARLAHINHWLKKGLFMMSVGGLAIAVGIGVGKVLT